MAHRRLPPLTAVLTFEAAARLENASRAAEELGVTHGAVSRQIKALERWAGVPLFERRGRRLVLTEAGRAYAQSATLALDGLAAASGRLRETAPGRRLTINALPTFAMRWLIPRLPGFLQLHGGIELRLVTSNLPVQRVGDPYDVAVRRGPDLWPGHVSTPFLAESETLACSPSLLARRPLDTPWDLAGHVLLDADTRPGAWERWLAVAGVPGLSPAGHQRFDHYYVALQAAVDGLGVVLAPLPLITDDLAAGRLVLPLPDLVVPTRGYYVLVPERAAGDHVVEVFRSWLVDEGRSGPGQPPRVTTPD
jgi:LysR family transcriptional regulator, glycine cleavage system transcriptional activator